MSPLRKLVGLAKWQKNLKKKSGRNSKKTTTIGRHLAYLLYSERVEQKCVKEKSLAIAHDREDLYIEPPPKTGKKKKAKAVKDKNNEMFEEN